MTGRGATVEVVVRTVAPDDGLDSVVSGDACTVDPVAPLPAGPAG